MSSPIRPSEFLSPSDAADYLGVHPKTLQKWARAGIVRAQLLPGGSRRYAIADLDAVFTPTEPVEAQPPVDQASA